MKKLSLFKAGSASVVLGLALASAPVYAQDQDRDQDAVQDQDIQDDVQDDASAASDNVIIVTGSRIARRDLETAAPVAVVDSEEFTLSGTVNVEQVINSLPQVIPGTTAFSNNPGNGAATLNLRGLGSNRTMVLVNGRRYMFYDTGQIVDLNTIPTFLIESVDVVTGGASAVYGSDAVAGVVNFRLKQNLEGVMAGAQYDITEEGDGRRYNAYVAMGGSFADGRGNATVFAEYYRRDDVFGGQRDFSFFALDDDVDAAGNPTLSAGGSPTHPNGILRYDGGASGLGPNGLGGNPPPPGDFANNRNVFFQGLGDFRPLQDGLGDFYNFAPVNYLMIPQTRYLLGGFANYEFTDGHEAYTEVSFVHNRVPVILAATPVTGTFNIDLDSVAGFLGANEIATLRNIDTQETTANTAAGVADDPGVVRMFVRKRTVETGGREQTDERNAFRVLFGARGEIINDFNYDVYYSYSRTRNSQVQAGNISRSAFSAGLDGSADPINIFGPNSLDQSMVDQISILAQNGEISSLQVASGSVSGPITNLGLGADDIGIAFGAEYRRVASRFIPDTALASGDVIGFNAGLPTAGGYHVEEIFGEIRVPIAADMPGIYNLEVNGAVRYSDYSLAAVGGVWTWAAGAEYAPFRDLKLRGQYQRAVRAPNVDELFGGQRNNFPSFTDPCATPDATVAGTLQSLCVASGVPLSSLDPANIGTAGRNLVVQPASQIENIVGGNPLLQEEKSDSYTFGAVFTPSFIPGLSVTADYWNVKVEGAITSYGGGLATVLDICYNQIQDINDPFCQPSPGFPDGIPRNGVGAIEEPAIPRVLQANVSKLKVAGIDLEVKYSTNVPFSLMTDTSDSRIHMSFLGTWTDKANTTPVEELPDVVVECAGTFGSICGEPTPTFKWTSRFTWQDGPLTTSVRWRHISGVDDDDDSINYFVERLGGYDLVDLSFAFDVTDNFAMSVGVRNIFDKKPTIIGDNDEQANTFPSTYDVLGRDYFVSASMHF